MEDFNSLPQCIVHFSTDGIFAFNRSYEITVWNPKMEEISNKKKEECIGKNIFQMFPHLQDCGEKEYFENVLKGKNSLAKERKYKFQKDSPDQYYDTCYSPIKNKNGQVIGGTGVVRDINHHQNFKEELKASEDRYKRLIDFAPMAIVVHLNKEIIFANHEASRIVGLENTKRMIGKSVIEFLHPDHKEEALSSIAYVLSEQKPTNREEAKFLRSDGTVIYVEIVNIPFYYKNELAIQTVAYDITERKQTEKALLENERQLDLVLRAAELGFWDWNIKTGKVNYNDRWAEMLGYSPHDIESDISTWEKLVHPEDKILADRAINKHYNGSQLFQNEFRMRTKRGRWKWILSRGKIVEADKKGVPLRAVGTHLDISKRKHAENKIIKQRNLLKGIADAAFTLLSISDFDQAMNGALERIGHAAGVDRVYIYKNHPREGTGQPAFSKIYEWASHKVDSLRDHPRLINKTYEEVGLKRFHETLSKKGHISGSVQSLEKSEYDFIKPLGIKSIAIVPIFINDVYWGVIGLDDCHSERKWNKSEISMLQAMAGNIGAIISQKEAKESLQASEKRLQTFFSNSLDGCFFLMLDIPVRWNSAANKDKLLDYVMDHMKVSKINDAMAEQYGAGKSDFENFKLKDFFKHNIANGKKLIRQCLDDGKVQVVTDERKLDGSTIWIEGNYVCLNDSAHRVSGIFGIQRDITERKKAYEEQQELTGELTRSNNELKQFAYVTSHNLRAPVVNLIGLLNLLDKESLEDDENLFIIEKMESAVGTLNNTLNDLIEIVVLRKEVKVPNDRISFDDIVNSVLESIEDKINKHNVFVECDFSGAPSITYSHSHLQSIILNLLTNAIKYRSRERSTEIKINTRKVQRYICLTIEDNGLGIDLARYKEKLFKLYQQFHETSDGKGMGLYIVKTQVEALGGKIEVGSEVGVGTTFRIYLKDFSRKKS